MLMKGSTSTRTPLHSFPSTGLRAGLHFVHWHHLFTGISKPCLGQTKESAELQGISPHCANTTIWSSKQRASNSPTIKWATQAYNLDNYSFSFSVFKAHFCQCCAKELGWKHYYMLDLEGALDFIRRIKHHMFILCNVICQHNMSMEHNTTCF